MKPLFHKCIRVKWNGQEKKRPDNKIILLVFSFLGICPEWIIQEILAQVNLQELKINFKRIKNKFYIEQEKLRNEGEE